MISMVCCANDDADAEQKFQWTMVGLVLEITIVHPISPLLDLSSYLFQLEAEAEDNEQCTAMD